MTRTLQGLAFTVISPSYYALASHPVVDISFIGDRWALHVPDEDGEPMIEIFARLDDAVTMLRLAINGVASNY